MGSLPLRASGTSAGNDTYWDDDYANARCFFFSSGLRYCPV
jgi:hypothetical protein